MGAAVSQSIADVTDRLVRNVRPLRFGEPVTHVYNPLEYARACYDAYLTRHARRTGPAILLGMNPGPWGMAQTGVPFGEVHAVRDWLGIRAPVSRPPLEHPKRPVLGLECERSEVSGARLWGWARETFHTPEAFFKRFFVANYCPLAFLEQSGRNRTPDKLPRSEREPLFAACDAALRGLVDALEPRWVIGIGVFAEARAAAALVEYDLLIERIPHPSPASPLANRGWAALASKRLREIGAVS